MTEEQWPLKKEEFDEIYSKVPRLTVEVIVRDKHGAVYLTQRAIGPCKGLWHLPGGTVQFGETLFHAVQRVALRELSIDVQRASNCGYIEYPSHYLKRRDCPVGLVFEVAAYSGNPMVNAEARRRLVYETPGARHPDRMSSWLIMATLQPSRSEPASAGHVIERHATRLAEALAGSDRPMRLRVDTGDPTGKRTSGSGREGNHALSLPRKLSG